MTNIDTTFLILLLPLWIFLIIMGGRFFAVYLNKRIIYALTLFSSLLGACVCLNNLINFKNTVEYSVPFIKINDFCINAGLHIDKLSLIIALVLFAVSFLIQAFSISYMKNEVKNYRFFAFLNMFNFAMAGLLFSPNLFQMYALWELAGIMSYLLIGFDYKNEEKSEASRRVFLMNRTGDTALLGGIILVSYFMYNYAGNHALAALEFEDMNVISTILSAYTSTPLYCLICGLFIAGAAVKSAQFPFYTWLQDAMEAKLPVSALLHSATIVAAGIYLLIRLVPFLELTPVLLKTVAALGIFTALLCSILASLETHPKKVLAYSTSANLGLMFLAIGMLNIKAAVVFLAAHAFTKSMLFLTLSVKNSYAGYISFLLGGLSLAGLIFAGMTAKEIIFLPLNGIWSLLFIMVSFMTAFYIIKLSLVMIQDEGLDNTFDWSKLLPIAGLFVLNIALYFFIKTHLSYKIAEPFYVALAGWITVYLLYTKNRLDKIPAAPRILERIYNIILVKVYEAAANFCKWIELSIFENYKPIKQALKASVNTFGLIETHLMDGAVNLTVKGAKKISEWGAKLQSGNVQTYNAYAFIIITAGIALVLAAYGIFIGG